MVVHEFQDPFVNLLQSSREESTDVGKILKSRFEKYLEQNKNALDGLEINMYSYEDPFVAFLRSDGGLMLCHFIKIQSNYKYSWEFPFSSSLFFHISKNSQRIQLTTKILTWFHWLFHFT